MFPVLLIFLSLWRVDAAGETLLKSPPVTNFGTWNEWSRCPDGEYVHGMRIKYEIGGRGTDNTALNSVKLYCQAIGYGGFRTDHSIMSGEGMYGDWQGMKSCPQGTYGIGFALRSQSFQNGGDNVGADNFALYCGTVNGPRNRDSWVQGDADQWGDWTADQFCPQGSVICGIQTQINLGSKQAVEDRTSLNNVRVECCSVKCPKYQFETVTEYDNTEGAGTVEGKYTKRVSFTKISSVDQMVTEAEKQAIIEKVSKSAGFSYETPIKTKKISGSGSSKKENKTERKTISTKELTTMVQEASTHERSDEILYTLPAFQHFWVDQLVLICGDVRVGLSKTVTEVKFADNKTN